VTVVSGSTIIRIIVQTVWSTVVAVPVIEVHSVETTVVVTIVGGSNKKYPVK